jgi:hypothetical protein
MIPPTIFFDAEMTPQPAETYLAVANWNPQGASWKITTFL